MVRSGVILDCNRCTTKFSVDPNVLGRAGRVVRCSSCGNLWHQDPPADFFPELTPEEKAANIAAHQAKRAASAAQAGAGADAAGGGTDPGFASGDPLSAHLRAAGVDPLNESPFPLRNETRGGAAAEAGAGPGGVAGGDWPDPVASWSGAKADAGGKRGDSIRPLSRLKREKRSVREAKERKEIPWQRWAALFAFFCASVVLALTQTETMVGIWPASARLYAVLGLSSPLDALGLQPRDARSYERMTADGRVLVVEGRVLNTAAEPRTPPKLWAIMLADGKEVASFAIKPTARSIAPGESVPFRGEFANPPPLAKSLKLDFRP
jgi:predicted Zn finger-like uncharacterized protein